MYKQEFDNDKPCIYFAIGANSRSISEGLDVTYCTFQKKHRSPDQWDHAIVYSQSYKYPQLISDNLCNINKLLAFDFCKFDRDLGQWMGEQIKSFILFYSIGRIDVIGSHGHIIWNSPGISVSVGHPAYISAQTQYPVVGDFHSLDIALGGNGGPLLPVGDRLFYERFSFCLNLGQVASITHTSPLDNRSLIAYDICVCDQLLSDYIDKTQDKQTKTEALNIENGEVVQDLLDHLNDMEFHSKSYPKSIDTDYMKNKLQPIMEQFCHISLESKLITSIEMITTQVAKIIEKIQKDLSQQELSNSLYMPKFHMAEDLSVLISNQQQRMNLLVCGEGVYYHRLLKSIKEKVVPFGVDIEELENETKYKESMIFAFLAILRIRKQINILDTITGASQSSSSGCIYHNFIKK